MLASVSFRVRSIKSQCSAFEFIICFACLMFLKLLLTHLLSFPSTTHDILIS